MFFGGRDTGRPNFRPASGLRALAGAFFARSPRGFRSPLLWASTSARFDGTLASTACRSITLSPSTTPNRNPSLDSNPTIFMTLEAPSCAEWRDYKKRGKARLYVTGLISGSVSDPFGRNLAEIGSRSARPMRTCPSKDAEAEHEHRPETQA